MHPNAKHLFNIPYIKKYFTTCTAKLKTCLNAYDFLYTRIDTKIVKSKTKLSHTNYTVCTHFYPNKCAHVMAQTPTGKRGLRGGKIDERADTCKLIIAFMLYVDVY